jgi:predicted nucleotidyltransferase
MKIDELLQDKREAVLALAARYGASDVRVFGSTARGEAGPESDIDLLVTLESSRTLLDQIALWQDLEDLLGRKVDVVTESALHHAIRERVLREAVPL